jgi:hypothetical protein
MVARALFGFILELIIKESVRGLGVGGLNLLQGKCPVFEPCPSCPDCNCPDINQLLLTCAVVFTLILSVLSFVLGFCCAQFRVNNSHTVTRKQPRIRDDRALFNALAVRE